MDGPGDLVERIESLERRIAYQDLTIQDLSDRVFEQQKLIDKFETQVRVLSSRLKDLSDGGSSALPSNERPPHY